MMISDLDLVLSPSFIIVRSQFQFPFKPFKPFKLNGVSVQKIFERSRSRFEHLRGELVGKSITWATIMLEDILWKSHTPPTQPKVDRPYRNELWVLYRAIFYNLVTSLSGLELDRLNF